MGTSREKDDEETHTRRMNKGKGMAKKSREMKRRKHGH